MHTNIFNIQLTGLVISDRVALNGASKADVRQSFNAWCEGLSEERDGPGAIRPRVKWLPRFKHCVYVDRKCLDTLAKMPADYLEPQWLRRHSDVLAVVIDGAFDQRIPGPDQGMYPDLEGCTERYVGWKYEEIEMLVNTYDEAHVLPLSEIEYQRPLLSGPTGYRPMLS